MAMTWPVCSCSSRLVASRAHSWSSIVAASGPKIFQRLRTQTRASLESFEDTLTPPVAPAQGLSRHTLTYRFVSKAEEKWQAQNREKTRTGWEPNMRKLRLESSFLPEIVCRGGRKAVRETGLPYPTMEDLSSQRRRIAWRLTTPPPSVKYDVHPTAAPKY